MEYVAIFEKGENSYGASVSDLPGCIAVGETMAEVRKLIAEVIEFHIEGYEKTGMLFRSHRQAFLLKAIRGYRPH